MQRLLRLVSLVVVVTFFAILFHPSLVLAHERRTIAGKYDVVVGWDKEPAFVNQLNGASIAIYKTGTQEGIEGVEKTLKVQIGFGGNAPKEFPLRSVFGRKGYYVADVLPTRAGDYVFTFVGTIEDTPVNERFESGPNRFDGVESTDALVLSSAETSAGSDLRAARDEASSAHTLAMVGIGIGLLGVIVGGLSLVTRRSR